MAECRAYSCERISLQVASSISRDSVGGNVCCGTDSGTDGFENTEKPKLNLAYCIFCWPFLVFFVFDFARIEKLHFDFLIFSLWALQEFEDCSQN